MAAAAAGFGLPIFAYLYLPMRSASKPLLISNYPKSWTAHYLRNRYQKLDPVITRAKCGGCPFLWGSDWARPRPVRRRSNDSYSTKRLNSAFDSKSKTHKMFSPGV